MTPLSKFLERYEGRPAHAKLKSLLTPFLEFCEEQGKDASDFDEPEVMDYILIERADYAPETKKTVLKSIRRFVRWHYAHEVNPENEAEARLRRARLEQITLPPEAKKHSRKALEREELEKLLETAKIMGDSDYAVFYLLAYFGLRKGELESLTEDDVDWQEQFIEVTTAKTKEPRLLYFDDRTAGILLNALENNWRTIKYHRIKEDYKSLLPDINFSLHSLRHTFNTHMRRKLEDDSLLRALMGHSGSSMTDYYDEKFRSEIKEAMIDKHYFKGVEIP